MKIVPEVIVHTVDIYETVDVSSFVARVVTRNNEPATLNNLMCSSDLIYSAYYIKDWQGRVLKNRGGPIDV
jgi:hypothetical protein